MANPHKGEFPFKADGENYVFRFTTNGVCELEAMMRRTVGDMIDDVGQGNFEVLRAFTWSGLRKLHADVDLYMAGDIVDEVSPTIMSRHIVKAIALAFPAPPGEGKPVASAEGGSEAADPMKAAAEQTAGTGLASSRLG